CVGAYSLPRYPQPQPTVRSWLPDDPFASPALTPMHFVSSNYHTNFRLSTLVFGDKSGTVMIRKSAKSRPPWRMIEAPERIVRSPERCEARPPGGDPVTPLVVAPSRQSRTPDCGSRVPRRSDRCVLARKCMDHETPGAEHACTIRKKRRIVTNMFDDGAGHDEVGRAVAKRKSMRRRVGDDLVLELTVAAELLLGEVEG